MGDILQFSPTYNVLEREVVVEYEEIGRTFCQLAAEIVEGQMSVTEIMLRRANLEKIARDCFNKYG